MDNPRYYYFVANVYNEHDVNDVKIVSGTCLFKDMFRFLDLKLRLSSVHHTTPKMIVIMFFKEISKEEYYEAQQVINND